MAICFCRAASSAGLRPGVQAALRETVCSGTAGFMLLIRDAFSNTVSTQSDLAASQTASCCLTVSLWALLDQAALLQGSWRR